MGVGYKLSCGDDYTPVTDTTPNPNKFVFTISAHKQYEKGYILLVNYPNCTTFNGDKLLVFKGEYTTPPVVLDPHFLEDNSALIARFSPTKEGLEWAIALLRGVD